MQCIIFQHGTTPNDNNEGTLKVAMSHKNNKRIRQLFDSEEMKILEHDNIGRDNERQSNTINDNETLTFSLSLVVQIYFTL